MKTKDRQHRTVTIPWIGRDYTKLLARSLTRLGLNVQLPPATTDRTIRIGVRNTAEMVCFPLKPTLGNFVEAIENGADTLLMFDSQGQCRLRHYWKIQEFTLRNMGYEFEMIHVNVKNALPVLKQLSGASYAQIVKELLAFYGHIKHADKPKLAWADDKPNIGIIGEIFTCCDERINYGIEHKIEKLDCKPVNTVALSSFVRDNVREKLHLPSKANRYDKQARNYLNGDLGGHGAENIAHLLEMVDQNIGGIIHLLPMSCMPETSIEPFVTTICRQHDTPLLRIPIDENTAEANLDTRLETFIELIKMRTNQ